VSQTDHLKEVIKAQEKQRRDRQKLQKIASKKDKYFQKEMDLKDRINKEKERTQALERKH